MKGMILKDLYTMRSYLRTLVVMFVFYILLGLASRNSGSFAAIVGMLCIMMSISSYSYDQMCGWDAYGASLPVSRREMVGAKYLLALMLALVGTVITALSQCLFLLAGRGTELGDILPATVGAGASGLLMVILLIPIIYRFGVEKGRLVMVIFSAGIMASFFILAQTGFRGMQITDGQTKTILFMLPVVLIAATVISYRLSCRFFEQKDL